MTHQQVMFSGQIEEFEAELGGGGLQLATLPLQQESIALWGDLERELGTDFEMSVTGGLMVAENREQLDFLHVKAERERRLGLSVDVLERDALERIAPYFGPAVIGAEICYDEGKLNPLKGDIPDFVFNKD